MQIFRLDEKESQQYTTHKKSNLNVNAFNSLKIGDEHTIKTLKQFLLISHKVNFRTRNIIRVKEGYSLTVRR